MLFAALSVQRRCWCFPDWPGCTLLTKELKTQQIAHMVGKFVMCSRKVLPIVLSSLLIYVSTQGIDAVTFTARIGKRKVSAMRIKEAWAGKSFLQ